MTCALCGRPLRLGMLRTVTGQVFCLDHQGLPRCTFCQAPMNSSGSLCPRCAATAITDQTGVKRALPTVRAELQAMGIGLSVPVRVSLVSPAQMSTMSGHGTGSVSGLTQFSGVQVFSISVVAGLPGVEFGSVVAHECMHAWMAQRAFPAVPDEVAEGLCQLASYGWLRRQDDPMARALQRGIETDPDPVYGGGYRLVRDSVQRHGRRTVLETVRRTGHLPVGTGGP